MVGRLALPGTVALRTGATEARRLLLERVRDQMHPNDLWGAGLPSSLPMWDRKGTRAKWLLQQQKISPQFPAAILAIHKLLRAKASMSFGFSVGDFIQVGCLAYQVGLLPQRISLVRRLRLVVHQVHNGTLKAKKTEPRAWPDMDTALPTMQSLCDRVQGPLPRCEVDAYCSQCGFAVLGRTSSRWTRAFSKASCKPWRTVLQL